MTEEPHTDPPLVSVCVQTYEHAPYIEQCLNSILNQETTFPIEILVGEDDSSDGTREICQRFASQYPKIRLFLHERKDVIRIHGIATGRRNFMHNLAHARGKYIALCEGDDYWQDPHKLEKQAQFLEHHSDYSIAYHNAAVVDQDGRGDPHHLRLSDQPETTRTSADIITKPLMPLASLMFRREHLETLSPNFATVLNADIFLICHLAQFGNARFVDVRPSAYRLHQGGIWSPQTKAFKIRSNIHMLRTLYDALEAEYQPIVARKICQTHNKLMIQSIRSFQIRESLAELGRHLLYSLDRFGFRSVAYQTHSYVKLAKQMVIGR